MADIGWNPRAIKVSRVMKQDWIELIFHEFEEAVQGQFGAELITPEGHPLVKVLDAPGRNAYEEAWREAVRAYLHELANELPNLQVAGLSLVWRGGAGGTTRENFIRP
jgi:hypothetical protein